MFSFKERAYAAQFEVAQNKTTNKQWWIQNSAKD